VVGSVNDACFYAFDLLWLRSAFAPQERLTSKARLCFLPLPLWHTHKENGFGRRGWQKGYAELPPKILIVDDHHAARTTLRELLDCHSFQVCGDAQNGKEAIEKVMELKPDIVLLDINMPVMDGITAAYEIRRVAPATKIVFLTIRDGPLFVA